MAAFGIRLATWLVCVLAGGAFPAAESLAKAPALPATAPRPAPSPGMSDDAPPLPEPRPGPTPGPEGADTSGAGPDAPRRAVPPVPTEELSCRSRLRALGVDFSEHAPIDDPAGCIVAHPLSVRSLGRHIGLQPEAVLNCATAEAAADFAAGVVAPAARSVLGLDLVAVNHGSAYVCRPRNGTTKLSEHAFGNAIDLSGFELTGRRTIGVAAATDLKEADFLSRIRMAACGPFKTVLGPGTDADHEQHFHFDLAKRRNGGTYCR